MEDARLLSGVRRALDIRRLQRDYRHLKEKLFTAKLANPRCFAPLLTGSKAMFGVFQYVEAIARNTEPILITGETGTGKDLAAKAIHYNSERVSGPFVNITASALPEQLLESELLVTNGVPSPTPDSRNGVCWKPPIVAPSFSTRLVK